MNLQQFTFEAVITKADFGRIEQANSDGKTLQQWKCDC
jgi:hypothetical protein